MQKETESEYKFLVTEKQFRALWKQFSETYSERASKIQINYYYDTYDNTLSKENVTVRIRQVYDKLKWQIKRHSEEKGAFLVSDEYSGDLIELPKSVTVNGINEKLYLKGNLTTERKILHFGNDSIICFDINVYLGVIDFEIEIEYNAEDKEIAATIANGVGTKNDLITTKSARFFKRLEEINNGESFTTLC